MLMSSRMVMIVSAVCALGAAALAQPVAVPGAGGAAVALVPTPAPRVRRENPVTSIQEFVRVEGYARSPLRGIGIVTGLKGTGDSGQELLLARPLAEVYRNNGNPIPDLRDLAKAKSAAIVTISAEVPEGGGRYGDTIDVYVQASHSASSLKGGTLILSPLLGPSTSNPQVFAMASGPIVLEDIEITTSGRIRLGAQLIRDIRPRPVGKTFDLILRPHFRSFAVARMLAGEINGITADLESEDGAGQTVAVALDDTTIRVSVPEAERGSPSNFLASVLTKRFSPSLIDLPAMVVVNERTGSIVVTGDVEISSVAIGNDRLVVTTTTPPPVPTPASPIVERTPWTEAGSTSTAGERARLQDLLEAFKQLNVPVKEQIGILAQIHQAGRLHARFVRE
jgi:flagellar P-ring protein precursor FlgI